MLEQLGAQREEGEYLWIDCPGDEYRVAADGVFDHALCFSCDGGELRLDDRPNDHADGHFGSASGWVSLPWLEPEAPLTRRLLALHYRFLNRRVDLPLHPSWASWLRERGLQANEVEALKSMGVHAHRCQPDALSQKLDTTYELRDENDGSP